MIRLRIKPADVRRTDGQPLRGDEVQFDLVNHGGRILGEHETPEGYGDLKPGTTFVAPIADWYDQRRHWHFLEEVSDVEALANLGSSDGYPDPMAELRAALDDGSHNKLGKALKAVGAEVPKSKAERVAAAAELLGD